MTPIDVTATKALVIRLWPRAANWTADEWAVFEQRAGRIGIDADQADAALCEFKATSDKFPTVAGLLNAMRRAEAKPTIGHGHVRPSEKPLPQIEYMDGLTSFEWRVIQDPKFRPFARRAGRLPPEREAWIQEQARTRNVEFVQ